MKRLTFEQRRKIYIRKAVDKAHMKHYVKTEVLDPDKYNYIETDFGTIRILKTSELFQNLFYIR